MLSADCFRSWFSHALPACSLRLSALPSRLHESVPLPNLHRWLSVPPCERGQSFQPSESLTTLKNGCSSLSPLGKWELWTSGRTVPDTKETLTTEGMRKEGVSKWTKNEGRPPACCRHKCCFTSSGRPVKLLRNPPPSVDECSWDPEATPRNSCMSIRKRNSATAKVSIHQLSLWSMPAKQTSLWKFTRS